MPELPEVETIRKQLDHALKDRKILSVKSHTDTLRKKLDDNIFNEIASGRKILGVRRRAKYLLVDMTGSRVLLLHLGMTGSLRICKQSEKLLTHDRICFRLSKNEELRLRDIRKFGSVEAFELEKGQDYPPVLSKLGPEPLSDEFDTDYLFSKTRKRKGPIKNIIMAQEIVVGVGNIYASEALFRSRIRPERHGEKLSKKDCEKLCFHIKEVLKEALEWGGTTFSDYAQVDGTAGEFVQHLDVYGRTGEKCHHCPATIERIVLGGRSSFFCPRCQK